MPVPDLESRASRRTGQIRAAGWSARSTSSTASHLRAVAFLLLCGLVLFLPGFFNIPPIDRDEARFAQATKQMVETGDFVDIRFQDDVRYKKPVGIYWLQAAARRDRVRAWPAARAGAHLALSRSVADRRDRRGASDLLDGAGLRDAARRGLAGLIMASSVLLGVEARLAKTDAMLLLTVVAAMGAMARVYLSWQRGEDPGIRRGRGRRSSGPRWPAASCSRDR